MCQCVLKKLLSFVSRSRFGFRACAWYSNSSKIIVQPHDKEELLRATVFFKLRHDGMSTTSPYLLEQQLGMVFFRDIPFSQFRYKLNVKIYDKLERKIKKLEDRLNEKLQIDISLHDRCGSLIPSHRSCDEIFQSENILRIGSCDYQIVRHGSAVKKLVIPNIIMIDCPVHALVETTSCSPSDCTFKWYVSAAKSPTGLVAKYDDWILVGEGTRYVFTDTDSVGRWVKVSGYPKSDPEALIPELAFSVTSKRPIASGPVLSTPISNRHSFTLERTSSGCFRTVTYNLLADYYSHTEYSHEVLFPYCPSKYLDKNYRRTLLQWELENYNADVICLQEVDRAFFKGHLHPIWCDLGEFDGVFLPKSRTPAEGVAVLYRRDKFDLLENISLSSISQAFSSMDSDENVDVIRKYIDDNELLSQKWSEMQHCLAALVLRSVENPDNVIIAATTHLFSKSTFDHIRLLQMFVCLKHLEITKNRMSRSSGLHYSVVFGGDFNSPPESGLMKYTVDGSIEKDHSDWLSEGCENSLVAPISHHLSLRSSYDYLGPQVPLTNFTTIYQGCLDYLLYTSDHLKLKQAIPLLSSEELQKKIAIPNEYFPSDHVPLIADLYFANK